MTRKIGFTRGDFRSITEEPSHKSLRKAKKRVADWERRRRQAFDGVVRCACGMPVAGKSHECYKCREARHEREREMDEIDHELKDKLDTFERLERLEAENRKQNDLIGRLYGLIRRLEANVGRPSPSDDELEALRN